MYYHLQLETCSFADHFKVKKKKNGPHAAGDKGLNYRIPRTLLRLFK